jgi:hypothetical protein
MMRNLFRFLAMVLVTGILTRVGLPRPLVMLLAFLTLLTLILYPRWVRQPQARQPVAAAGPALRCHVGRAFRDWLRFTVIIFCVGLVLTLFISFQEW